MEEHQHREALRKEYLLGGLSEDERALLEESFLAGDDAFEEMDATEAELLYAYVRNELSPSERERVKELLLASPRLLERAKFTNTLEKTLAARRFSGPPAPAPVAISRETPQSFWQRVFGRFFHGPPRMFGVAMAGGAVLLLAFGALLLVQWIRLRNEAERLVAERSAIEQQKRNLGQESATDRTRVEQLSAELQQKNEQLTQAEKLLAEQRHALGQGDEASGQPPFQAIALALTPGLLRSTDPKRPVKQVTAGVPINLILSLEANDYPQYQVSIEDAAHRPVFHQERLRARSVRSANTLAVSIPADVLKPGSYSVQVNGVNSSGGPESVADYQFRVLPRQK